MFKVKSKKKIIGMSPEDFYHLQAASSLYQRTWTEREQAKMVIEKLNENEENKKKELGEGEEYSEPKEVTEKKNEMEEIVESNSKKLPRYKYVIDVLINKYF